MIKNLPQIVLLNIVGLALFLSWYIPVNHGFWLPIDADIFYFFNQKLVESKAFLWGSDQFWAELVQPGRTSKPCVARGVVI